VSFTHKFSASGFEPRLAGRVSVRQSPPTGKGNFQTGKPPSHNFPIVVTSRQGKVVAVNEAKDQHGGQLTFDNGESLNYEGGLLVPPRLFGLLI